jgi:hypothetical protein
MVVLLTAVCVEIFHESLTYYEIAGLVMGIGALMLLGRFA